MPRIHQLSIRPPATARHIPITVLLAMGSSPRTRVTNSGIPSAALAVPLRLIKDRGRKLEMARTKELSGHCLIVDGKL